MQQLSVSEIQRKLHKLDSFDIIEVVDKKKQKVKGYFVASKYFSFIEELVKSKNKIMIDQLSGSLHQYANPDLRDQEEGAWKKVINKKYKV